jgi:uncharacterized Fe-S center protein
VQSYAEAEGITEEEIPRNTCMDCSKWEDIAPEEAVLPAWQAAVARFTKEMQKQ